MPKPIFDRRTRFAQEYVKDLNATQAAVRCGYSPKTAKQQGSRLLTNADIVAQIQALQARVTAQNEVTVERTLKEIARIAYADPRKLYDESGNLRPIHELDDDTAATIAGVEVDVVQRGDEDNPLTVATHKIKRWDKGKALDQCMAYLGMHKTANPAEGGGLSLTINLSGGKRLK